jgi:Zn-dependent protease with chaperone function
MRINLPPPSPAKLARLEAAAAAHPIRYRFVLGTLALFGDITLTFVRAFPLAAWPILGALLYNSELFYWVAGITVLFLMWLVRPGYRDDGRPVSRQEMPDLYTALDGLKKDIEVDGPLQIQLDDEMNASAREVRGVFGLFGNRRLMTLGIPLLAIIGKDEARAIIGHELGHFSRRHGRFGHFLYWAHMGWLSHVELIDDDSTVLDRIGANFAHLFLPTFSRRAMVWSRRCEYEADADAARAAGAQTIISALARVSLFDIWQEREHPRLAYSWQCSEPRAPANYLDRLSKAFVEAAPELTVDLVARESGRGSDWGDTHPPMAQRAMALNVPIALTRRGEAGGPALLGTSWPAVVADYNARWQSAHAAEWAVAHKRYMLMEAPLLAASDAETAAWPIPQRLERARALGKLDPKQGIAALTALAAAAPDDRMTTFRLATAHLSSGDRTAIDRLKTIAEADPTFRVPVCIQLVRYFREQDDRISAEKWESQLDTSGAQLARAYDAVATDIDAGKAVATSRPQAFAATLFAGLATDPAVAKAWLLEGTAPLATKTRPHAATLRVDALVLLIDPFDNNQQAYDIDAVCDRHRDCLGMLIEPNALPIVLSFFTTEPVPAELAAELAKLPPTATYERSAELADKLGAKLAPSA